MEKRVLSRSEWNYLLAQQAQDLISREGRCDFGKDDSFTIECSECPLAHPFMDTCGSKIQGLRTMADPEKVTAAQKWLSRTLTGE